MVVGQPGKLVPVLRVVGSSPILVAKIKSLDLCEKRHKSGLFSSYRTKRVDENRSTPL